MKKERYGKITKTTETRVVIDGSPFKTTPESNAKMVNEKIIVGDEVIFTYDTKERNLIDLRRKPTSTEFINAETEQKKKLKLYMQEQKEGGAIPPVQTAGDTGVHIQPQTAALVDPVGGNAATSSSKTPNNADKRIVHMQRQKETAVEPRMWMPDDEKNNYILLQNVLARAVEIVNAYQHDYGKSFKEDTVTLRCILVESAADRLFDYVKKKVEQERDKNERTNQ